MDKSIEMKVKDQYFEARKSFHKARFLLEELREKVQGIPAKCENFFSAEDTNLINSYMEAVGTLLPSMLQRDLHLRIIFDHMSLNMDGSISKDQFLKTWKREPPIQSLITQWQKKHDLPSVPVIDKSGKSIFDKIKRKALKKKSTISFHDFLFIMLNKKVSPGALEGLGYSQEDLEEIVAPAHWGYFGYNGPSEWHNLSPLNRAAKAGKSQSPINIVTANILVGTSAMMWKPKYIAVSGEILNNGQTIHVNWKGGDFLSDGYRSFKCKQFQFRCPSEHTVDGMRYPLEIQFAHVNGDSGQIAFVAAFFKIGASSDFLEQLCQKMPMNLTDKAQPLGTIELKELSKVFENKNASLYLYMGSLTTPPCAERCLWNIATESLTCSEKQLSTLQKALGGETNKYRPTQPLNNRKVYVISAV